MTPTIERTIAFVKKTLADAEGGHDWFHINRVWNMSLAILDDEPQANKEIVELAALLHDIADSKFHNGDETIGPQVAKQFLQSIDVDELNIDHVIKIIENISFKGGNKTIYFNSLELDIVRDADRLDAIGAIGIGRAFSYGGHKNRLMFDPETPPELNMTPEQYKKSTAPTINHFYEKLLILKDGMTTTKGKSMAEERTEFLKTFLQQFYNEWYSGKTEDLPRPFLI